MVGYERGGGGGEDGVSIHCVSPWISMKTSCKAMRQEVEKRKPIEIEQNTLALNKVYPQGKLINQGLSTGVLSEPK